MYPELAWVWKAFVRLNRSRPIGFSGPLPLPLSDILALASALGLEDSERERFIDRIQAMDSAYLTEIYNQQQTANRGKDHGRTPTHR